MKVSEYSQEFVTGLAAEMRSEAKLMRERADRLDAAAKVLTDKPVELKRTYKKRAKKAAPKKALGSSPLRGRRSDLPGLAS